jgi:hypothetical protein
MIVDKITHEEMRQDPPRKIVEKIIKILAIIVNSQSVFYSSEDTREICEKSKFNEFA